VLVLGSQGTSVMELCDSASRFPILRFCNFFYVVRNFGIRNGLKNVEWRRE